MRRVSVCNEPRDFLTYLPDRNCPRYNAQFAILLPFLLPSRTKFSISFVRFVHYQPRHVRHRLPSFPCSNRVLILITSSVLGMLTSHTAWELHPRVPWEARIQEAELRCIFETYGNTWVSILVSGKRTEGERSGRNTEIIYNIVSREITVYYNNGRRVLNY